MILRHEGASWKVNFENMIRILPLFRYKGCVQGGFGTCICVLVALAAASEALARVSGSIPGLPSSHTDTFFNLIEVNREGPNSINAVYHTQGPMKEMQKKIFKSALFFCLFSILASYRPGSTSHNGLKKSTRRVL